MFWLVISILALCAFVLVWVRRGIWGNRILTGTVESFRLTWGQQGQQIVTIDGKNYNIWLNFKEFHKVERGNVITHRPHYDNRLGRRLLTTEIIEVQKKKNNAASQTKPGGEIPS